MTECETCKNLLDKETCHIYGTPNHDISKCKDYKKRSEKMSCLYCTEYQGLKEPCKQGKTIETLSESFNCEHYTYNGRVKYEQGM